MLEGFRNVAHNKFIKIIFAAVIILSFALWGVESYFEGNTSGDIVANVEGEKINAQEFNQSLREHIEQLRARTNNNVDANIIDNPEFRQSVLTNLINRRLMIADLKKANFVVTDKQLAAIISEGPGFQEDGKFSHTRYEAILRQQGLTPAKFESQARYDIATQMYQQAIAASSFVSKTSFDTLVKVMGQTREVSVVNYLPAEFIPQVNVSEASIKSYYETHKPEFTTPDQVKIEYVVLSNEELRKQIPVTDSDVQTYYQQHISKYQQPEERQASHILIKADKAASEADKKAALAKAEDILKQVNADPSKFAELAKKHSEDPGSAANGGDLGAFGKGMMVKPFEDAVFQMKKDEIRGPVQSDFGYHIIRLTNIKETHGKPLEEVKAEITADLQKEKAGKKFAESAEAFSNMVYEQSGSLKPVADANKLTIKQSGWLTRKGGESGEDAELNNEKLLQAIFGDEVLKNKRNTEAIEIAPGKLVSARLLEFKPSALQPLNEVSAKITEKLKYQEASKLAVKKGADQLAQIKKGTVPAEVKWENPHTISRQERTNLLPPVIEAIFKAPTKTLPAYVGVENPMGGYTVVRVTKVTDGSLADVEKNKTDLEQLRQIKAQTDLSNFFASLRETASINVKADVLKKSENQ